MGSGGGREEGDRGSRLSWDGPAPLLSGFSQSHLLSSVLGQATETQEACHNDLILGSQSISPTSSSSPQLQPRHSLCLSPLCNLHIPPLQGEHENKCTISSLWVSCISSLTQEKTDHKLHLVHHNLPIIVSTSSPFLFLDLFNTSTKSKLLF